MMRLPHAILIGFVFIAAALYFGGNTPVVGQSNTLSPRGPFVIARGDDNFVWRLDQATGLISYCYRDTSSLDRVLIKSRAPYCSGWGN